MMLNFVGIAPNDVCGRQRAELWVLDLSFDGHVLCRSEPPREGTPVSDEADPR